MRLFSICGRLTRTLGLLGLLILGVAPGRVQAQGGAAEAYQRAYNLVLDEQWVEAEAALRTFMQTYARSDWADDARFWMCYTQEQRAGDAEAAFTCYQRFTRDYPQSSWGDDARSNMVRLGRQLARSGRPEYEAIVRSMQDAGDEEVRLAALEALWQMGDDRALDAVIELYDEGASRTFKKKIVFVLSQFDAPRAAEKLKQIALRDDDAIVRKEAVFWIAEQGGADAIPLLQEVARAFPNELEVQKQIVYAYSELGSNGIPQLIEVARTHPSTAVRKDAIYWLSEAGGRQVLDFFGELMKKMTDVEVQKQIVYAYSELGQDGVPRLIEVARTHPNAAVRKDAIYWLSEAGGRQVLDFFGELMKTTTDVEVQKQIVYAYSELGSNGIPQLIEVARTHPSTAVRKDAIYWLSEAGGAKALAFFDELIKSTDDLEVQKQIVYLYAAMDEDGVPRLIEVARAHPNRQVRKDAIYWLGQSEDSRAREALLEIVQGQ